MIIDSGCWSNGIKKRSISTLSLISNFLRSEANDAAVQMARAYTGHFDVVVFEDGFHGSLGELSKVSELYFEH